MKKMHFNLLVIVMLVLTCFSCSKTEDTIHNELIDFYFNYEYNVPGTELSYNYMWDGYDLNNKYGPKLDKDNRLYSYLTEYLEPTNQYYLVYFERNLLDENKNNFYEYEKKYSHNKSNYHFSEYDEENIIDGKYYFSYQRRTSKNSRDIKYLIKNNLDDINFIEDGYQLVFCATSRKAIIKENISKQKIINKEITIYKRIELKYIEETNLFEEYIFSGYEAENQSRINEAYNYVGEMVEVYPETYEQIKSTSYPKLGMKDYNLIKTISCKIVFDNDIRYILLPRYLIDNAEKIDLLSNEIELDDDIFGNYKDAFKDAIYMEMDNKIGNYIYALYEYDKVSKIMQSNN